MRLFVSFLILAMVFAAGWQLRNLYLEKRGLEAEFSKLNQQGELLKQENQKLAADIGYFGDFRNLVKELKALFNYKKPGEKLFIVVPAE